MRLPERVPDEVVEAISESGYIDLRGHTDTLEEWARMVNTQVWPHLRAWLEAQEPAKAAPLDPAKGPWHSTHFYYTTDDDGIHIDCADCEWHAALGFTPTIEDVVRADAEHQAARGSGT